MYIKQIFCHFSLCDCHYERNECIKELRIFPNRYIEAILNSYNTCSCPVPYDVVIRILCLNRFSAAVNCPATPPSTCCRKRIHQTSLMQDESTTALLQWPRITAETVLGRKSLPVSICRTRPAFVPLENRSRHLPAEKSKRSKASRGSCELYRPSQARGWSRVWG